MTPAANAKPRTGLHLSPAAPAASVAARQPVPTASRPTRESSVSSHKVRQCRLSYRGRDFHFVSYEGHPANERRGETAMPAMWYLMGPAKRWPVMEHNPDHPDHQEGKGLLKWLGTQELGLPRREA